MKQQFNSENIQNKIRLKTLLESYILSNYCSEKYDEITFLISIACNVPIVSIHFTNAQRQWCQSQIGLDILDISKNFDICSHIESNNDFKAIKEASEKQGFDRASLGSLPFLKDNPDIKFFIAFPLIILGTVIGTLCIGDKKTRKLTDDQEKAFTILSNQICYFVESNLIQLEKCNLQLAMEASLKGVAELDIDRNFININQIYAKKFGYTTTDLIGHSLLETMPLSEHFKIKSAFKKVLNTQKETIETIGIHKDKHPFFKNLTLVAKYNFQKKVIGYYCFVQNIEQRKKTEIALEESKNFQDLVLKNHPDYIFIKDEDYKIILANEKFIGLYPEEQKDHIIGHTTIESYDQQQAEAFLKHDKIAFEEGTSETYETVDFPDGKKRILLTKKVRFQNTEGKNFILGIARDVTEREDLISKLKKSNDALDEFAYIAAHDLKEPVRGMSNHIYLLKRELGDHLSPSISHRMDRMYILIESVEALIQNLLYFSRLSNIDFAWQSTDLNQILPDIIKTIDAAFQGDIKFNVKNIPIIHCDKIRIGELFRNLITNAIKYNDRSIKEIEIGCLPNHPEHPNEHVLYVKDNGIGIAAEFHQKVFRIFKRLHSTKEYGGGMGTGLTFVKKIIGRHHGKIWIESDLNVGSTFFFSIPLKKSLER